MAALIGIAVKGVSAGIGLASESAKARKEKRRSKETGEIDCDNSFLTPQELADRGAARDRDEEQWELDEAQDEVVGGLSLKNKEPTRDISRLVHEFSRKYPPPAYPDGQLASPRLPFPVILPQRRPKDRSRGFVRAYAPVLDDCGIDQTMFLEFLETFHESSQASPWINAINMASFAGVMLPDGISIAVSAAVMIATNVAKQVQSRHR